MDIRTASADFSSPLRGSGPRTVVTPVIFPRTVQQAAAGLLGYTVAYGDNDDHHVGLIQIQVSPEINDNVVTVTATLGLRDWSGNWDDNYFGSVEFAVMADLAPATAPPPRGDVIITGVEYNQAVQFYRSDSYLDPQHVLPDNALPLVARKATGLRLYVDYDASAGLPPINNLTGQVTVQTSATTLTLNPINPGGAIVPLPEASINMAVADQTLNFMIPAVWCTGSVTITAQVWDQADPSSKSASFTRTLTFRTVKALDIFIVGVHYTAQGLNLPAPTQAQITASGLTELIKRYPVGDVVQTGYRTLDFNKDVNFTIGNSGGCGDGMSSLLDQLDDMRGGSNEVYVAFLPPLSQIQEAGSNIGGCGHHLAGAIFIDIPGDVPHEIGHALDRQHAPCNPGMCSPAPANVDSSYPQYGAFPAGSIGVFGFDPATNTVFDPSSTADFMAYWFPQWVSAYTYMALAGAFPPTGGGAGAGLVYAHAITNVPIETLFLKIVVNRERHVRRVPSFHFPALPQSAPSCGNFVAELLNDCRDTLVCVPMDCGCTHRGCHCWPRQMSAPIPFPKGARWLVIWEGDRKLYEECIPRPPRIKITGAHECENGYLLQWEVQFEKEQERCHELWYLVHWYDEEREVWRGVAPRTQLPEMLVPRSLLWGEAVRVRVLATAGVATGFAEVRLKGYPGRPSVNVYLAGYDESMRSVSRSTHVVHAMALDAAGKQAEVNRVIWYSENGAEIGRGPQLDLRTLPAGRNLIRVVMRTEDGTLLAKSWLIERSSQGHVVHGAVTDTRSPRPKKPHTHPHPKPDHK